MTHDHTPEPQRPTRRSLARGWRGKCPKCGKGRIFGSYLSVNTSCHHCDQELHHHRADDGPAYITILLSAHIFGPLMLVAFEIYRPSAWILVSSFSVAFVAFALYFLPRIKGALIALQWAKRMHGFGHSDIS